MEMKTPLKSHRRIYSPPVLLTRSACCATSLSMLTCTLDRVACPESAEPDCCSPPPGTTEQCNAFCPPF